MRLFRFALNTWITIASIGSFLVGWVALAHSPKPVQPTTQSAQVSSAVLPTLTPLQDLQFGSEDTRTTAYFENLPADGVRTCQQGTSDRTHAQVPATVEVRTVQHGQQLRSSKYFLNMRTKKLLW